MWGAWPLVGRCSMRRLTGTPVAQLFPNMRAHDVAGGLGVPCAVAFCLAHALCHAARLAPVAFEKGASRPSRAILRLALGEADGVVAACRVVVDDRRVGHPGHRGLFQDDTIAR